MSKPTKLTIEVLGTSITVLSGKNDDYISLTDMLKIQKMAISSSVTG
jgi:hypothetical protein